MDHQQYDHQDYAQEKKKSDNPLCQTGNTGESKHSANKCDDEENKCPVQHNNISLLL
jgi:hypothetical protein